MFKADSQLLAHTTNQQLIDIRLSELRYFDNFFVTLGIQATIIAGFSSSSIVQTAGLELRNLRAYKTIYWITCSATLGVSMYCLFLTSFVTVLAPRLAIRGPIGSVVKAVNGMYSEQATILASFVASCALLGINTVTLFFMIMDLQEAYASAGFIVLSFAYTTSICLRIHRRFYWKEELDLTHRGSTSSTQSGHSLVSSTEHVFPVRPAVLPDVPDDTTDGQKPTGFFSRMFRKVSEPPEPIRPSVLQMMPVTNFSAVDQQRYKEGYMSKMVITSTVFDDTFTRYFFVLSDGCLWYYPGKKDFDDSPEEPVKRRPLRLSAFSVQITSTTAPFELKLVQISGMGIQVDSLALYKNAGSQGKSGMVWKLRTNTLDELQSWVKVLKIAAL